MCANMAYTWTANGDAIYDQIKTDLLADFSRPSPMKNHCVGGGGSSGNSNGRTGNIVLNESSRKNNSTLDDIGCFVNTEKELSHNNQQQQHTDRTGLVSNGLVSGGVHQLNSHNKRINQQQFLGVNNQTKNNAMSGFCGSMQVVRYYLMVIL